MLPVRGAGSGPAQASEYRCRLRFGLGGNRPYYVTEFTPLGSMAQSMRDREAADHRPMDPREAVRLLEMLAPAIYDGTRTESCIAILSPGTCSIFPGPKAALPMFSK